MMEHLLLSNLDLPIQWDRCVSAKAVVVYFKAYVLPVAVAWGAQIAEWLERCTKRGQAKERHGVLQMNVWGLGE